MSSAFTGKNCCAVVLAAVVVALMIAAASAPWYTEQITFEFRPQSENQNNLAATSSQVLNYTKVFYDLQGWKQEVKTNVVVNGVATSKLASHYNNYDSDQTLKHIVKTSQAFVLVALITGIIVVILLFCFFFDRIRNKMIFAAGMTLTRLAVVFLVAIIVLSTIVAFLVFVGVVQAFKNDRSNCIDGPCRRFVDATETESVQQDGSGSSFTLKKSHKWGPEAGWYITLGAIPCSIILLLIVVINKFPLPIDSEASSGEAL